MRGFLMGVYLYFRRAEARNGMAGQVLPKHTFLDGVMESKKGYLLGDSEFFSG